MSSIFPMSWTTGNPEDWGCPVRLPETKGPNLMAAAGEKEMLTETSSPMNTSPPYVMEKWAPDIQVIQAMLADDPPMERVEEVVKTALAPDRPERPIWGIWQTQAWPLAAHAGTNSASQSFVSGAWFRGNGIVFHTPELCVALAQLSTLRGDAAFAGLNAEYYVRRIDLWAGKEDLAEKMWPKG